METAVVARGITHHRPDCGHGNSNDAEWMAVIHALEIALEIGADNIVLIGDSALVIGQANGLVKCRNPSFQAKLELFRQRASRLERVKVRLVGRSQNLAGIALAKARWS
jgi:ribonuclease HI